VAYRAVCEIVQPRCGADLDTLCNRIFEHAGERYRAGPFHEYCESIGISRTECLWGDFGDGRPDIQKLAQWIPVFRRQTWLHFLAEYGINDAAFAEDIQNRFIEERQRRQVVFPDVEPALRELQKQYRLALLTNGAPSLQRFKINASGLSPYLANVTISGDLGYGKPDPRIFQHTIDLLGVPPEAAVMIGDNLRRDIYGAQNAGLHGIWINRFNDPKPNNLGADGIIGNLWQLTAMLKQRHI
jgi:putative hydrolase of the HAD superfamily